MLGIKRILQLATTIITIGVSKAQYFRIPTLFSDVTENTIVATIGGAPELFVPNKITMLPHTSFFLEGNEKFLIHRLRLIEGDTYIDDTEIQGNNIANIWLQPPPTGSFDTQEKDALFNFIAPLEWDAFRLAFNPETVPRMPTQNPEYQPDIFNPSQYQNLILRKTLMDNSSFVKDQTLNGVGGNQIVVFAGKNIQTINIEIPANFSKEHFVVTNRTIFWDDFGLESSYYTYPEQIGTSNYFITGQIHSPHKAYRLDVVDPSIHTFQLQASVDFTTTKPGTTIFVAGAYNAEGATRQKLYLFDSSVNNSPKLSEFTIGGAEEYTTELKFNPENSAVAYGISFKFSGTSSGFSNSLDDYFEKSRYNTEYIYDFFLTKYNSDDFTVDSQVTRPYAYSYSEVDYKHYLVIIPETNFGFLANARFSMETYNNQVDTFMFNLETLELALNDGRDYSPNHLQRTTFSYIKELKKHWVCDQGSTSSYSSYSSLYSSYTCSISTTPLVQGDIKHKTCKTSINDADMLFNCFECRDGYDYLSDGRCVCPSDSYDDGESCQTCDGVCSTCFGPGEDKCLTCSGDLIQLENGTCIVNQTKIQEDLLQGLTEEEKERLRQILVYYDGPYTNFSQVPLPELEQEYPEEDTLEELSPEFEELKNSGVDYYPEAKTIFDEETLNLVTQVNLEEIIGKEVIKKINFTQNFQLFFTTKDLTVKKVGGNDEVEDSEEEVGNTQIDISDFFRLQEIFYEVTYDNQMFKIKFKQEVFENMLSSNFVVLTGRTLVSRRMGSNQPAQNEQTPIEGDQVAPSTQSQQGNEGDNEQQGQQNENQQPGEEEPTPEPNEITYEYDTESPKIFLNQLSYLIIHKNSKGTRYEVDKSSLEQGKTSIGLESGKLVVYMVLTAGGISMATMNILTPLISLMVLFQTVDTYKNFININTYFGNGPLKMAFRGISILEVPQIPLIQHLGIIEGTSSLKEKERELRKLKHAEAMNLTIREKNLTDDEEDPTEQIREEVRRVLAQDRSMDYFYYNGNRNGKLGLGNRNSFVLSGDGTFFFLAIILYGINKIIFRYLKKCDCLEKILKVVQGVLLVLIELKFMFLFYVSIVDLTIHRLDFSNQPLRVNFSFVASIIILHYLGISFFLSLKLLFKMKYELTVTKNVRAKNEDEKDKVFFDIYNVENYPEEYKKMKKEDRNFKETEMDTIRVLEVRPVKEEFDKLSLTQKVQFEIWSSKMNLFYAKKGISLLGIQKVKLILFQIIISTAQSLPKLQVIMLLIISVAFFSLTFIMLFTKRIIKRPDYFLKKGTKIKILVQESCLVAVSLSMLIFSYLENSPYKVSPFSQLVEVVGSISMIAIVGLEAVWVLADFRLGFKEWNEKRMEAKGKGKGKAGYGKVTPAPMTSRFGLISDRVLDKNEVVDVEDKFGRVK